MMMSLGLRWTGPAILAALAGLILIGGSVASAQECRNHGQLDALYCDNDNDLVADTPTDPRRQKDPATLVFAYTPVEDPAVYQNVFRPFTDHLAQCTGKRVIYYPVQSNTAEIAIVKASSPYQKLSDLKGKRVAHTSPSSNSGNLAPRVLFAPEGLKPDEDYRPLMSGGHDKSTLGVASGDYDMAPVASDVFHRMVARGTVKGDDFRIIYESPLFPTSSFAYSYDLKPELANKIRECFFQFRFTPEMAKEFDGNDRFFPITYKEHWAVVREIAEKTGTPFNKTAYEAESKREAQELQKKQLPTPAQPKQ